MTEKNYLETFKKCPGSVYFPLLLSGQKIDTIVLFNMVETSN